MANGTVGPPTKLNPTIIKALSEYIRKGNYLEPACNLVGIHRTTLHNWLKQAEEHIEVGVESEYTVLFYALKEAEAQAEHEMVQVARGAAIEHRNAIEAMMFLERRAPDRWGRRERHDINIEQKSLNIVRVEVAASSGHQLEQPGVKELKEGEE